MKKAKLLVLTALFAAIAIGGTISASAQTVIIRDTTPTSSHPEMPPRPMF